jgi:diguanylate cyclase (GGDEF)-like protein
MSVPRPVALLWGAVLLWTSLAGGAAAPRPGELAIERLPAEIFGTWEISFESAPPRDDADWRPVRVPGAWQASGFATHGFAWLRARIRLSPRVCQQALAFSSTQIRDADEMYLDGVQIGSSGAFPPVYSKATLVDRVYPLPPSLAAAGPHVLLLRVYNAGPRGGGITGIPRIERLAGAIVRRSRRDVLRIVLASSIGAMGLAVLIFYLRDRKQLEFLFFFLYAVSISAYQLTWVSIWATARSPASWQVRLNMFFVFVILAFYIVFNLRVFGRSLQRRHIAVLGAIAILCALTLAWPRVDDLYYFLAADEVVFVIVAMEMLTILVKDTLRRIPYAAPVLAGTIVCVLGAAFDILQDMGFLGDPAGTFRLLGPAIFVFTVVYLWVMADRFVRATQAAMTDPLTGLPNRNLLFERLSQEVSRSKRNGQPCALAILDLDDFKSFNDRFGHLAGDQLLRVVANAIRRSTRDTDLVARYGGEEFVIVLPGSNRDVATRCLERIRFEVAQARVGSNPETRSASIGAVIFDPVSQPSIGMLPLLRNADAALYSAKAAGRNRLVLVQGPLRETISGPLPIPKLGRT